MTESIRIDGLTMAPGVVETVMRVATESVEGVAGVGAPGLAGFAQRALRKSSEPMVEVVEDGEALRLRVYVQVFYGHPLPDVAARIRSTVADAVVSQIGVRVESIDVYVDSIVFAG